MIRQRPLQELGRQTLAGASPEHFELLAAADQVTAPFAEFVAGCGIGLVDLLQAIAQFVQVLNELHELVVKPPGALGDFTGILALAFLLPQAVDHPQSRQQGRWADNHDLPVKGLLEQVRFSLQSR